MYNTTNYTYNSWHRLTVYAYVGIQGIFARKSGNATSYLLKNAHGDVTAQVSGGTVTKRYDYDAYGTEKSPDATDTNPFRSAIAGNTTTAACPNKNPPHTVLCVRRV